jgi:ornithine carbamoyltransferase
MKTLRHFLKETDFSVSELDSIFSLAHALKAHRHDPAGLKPLIGQTWGMLFFKNSTRTRISFDVGVHELGAHPLFLDQHSMQISRGESISDTAKVMSRYLHGIIIRAYAHELLEEFVREGSIPVINALTDFLHPCQVYSDAFSIAEKFTRTVPSPADLVGRKLVFVGDCDSNMANSWILGGCLMGMEIVLCGPDRFQPGSRIRELAAASNLRGTYRFTTDIASACAGADVIYTDVWVSMGDEAEAEERRRLLGPYQVTRRVMELAKPGALFMHCLPAHEGEEVHAGVLALPNSIIFDQAENRLHMQKAIMATLDSLKQPTI